MPIPRKLFGRLLDLKADFIRAGEAVVIAKDELTQFMDDIDFDEKASEVQIDMWNSDVEIGREARKTLEAYERRRPPDIGM